jgi:hypothetical protein
MRVIVQAPRPRTAPQRSCRKTTAYRDCVPKGRFSHLEADELPYTGDLEADRQADRAVGDIRTV